MNRRGAIAGTLAAGAVLLLLMDQRAADGNRDAVVATWTRDAESEAAFVAAALARRNDLLVVERIAALAKRDDLAYAVICDATGRATFHSDVAQIGMVYDSPVAKRALGTAGTLVQEAAAAGIIEIDAPVGGGAVLRLGFADRAFAAPSRWMWAGAAASLVAAVAAGLMGLARA
jgi:hypothetical protein